MIKKIGKEKQDTITDIPTEIEIPYFLRIQKDDTLLKKVIRLFRPQKGIKITIDAIADKSTSKKQ